MEILLIAGLWLEASAWDAVVPALRSRGHRVTAVSLPGQGAPPENATLEDQQRAVLNALDAAEDVALFEIVDGAMPFPGWPAFEGADAADLDPSRRRAIAAAAVPVPEGVARGRVRLADERRYGVPVTLVCPEYSADDARGWIESGQVPELSRARSVDYVEIDSGHWPMFTRPTELAALLHAISVR